VVRGRAGGEHSPKLFELAAWRIIATESDRAFELIDQRIQRRVGMMWRTEISPLDMRLTL